MTAPKPLDLEELIKRMKNRIVEIEHKLNIISGTGPPKNIMNEYTNSLIAERTKIIFTLNIIKDIKERIKSALEFYEKYRAEHMYDDDKPSKFHKDVGLEKLGFKRDEIYNLTHPCDGPCCDGSDLLDLTEYNNKLLKYAFKGVFRDEDKD